MTRSRAGIPPRTCPACGPTIWFSSFMSRTPLIGCGGPRGSMSRISRVCARRSAGSSSVSQAGVPGLARSACHRTSSRVELPFDLMIGPVRNVYPAGVAGGRDLFDRRVSLYEYRELFNHFAKVRFPVSTLAPDAGAELVAYSWIFPNVLPMGHWWYSNVPAYIAADLKARIQALPKVKLLGYYSDAYKLEFILPKFNMYRRILAETLAEECVRGRGWSVDRALQLGKVVLLDNPRRIFGQNRWSPGTAI